MTKSPVFDVIVAGMGAAACWYLARRGLRVLGLERFEIPHATGSSHGVNRITRMAYFEHPADGLSREPTARDEEFLRRSLRSYFPDADGALLDMQACLFTNTPDEHFVIDSLPDAPQVMVASPWSGHGFKFAPAVGEALADLVAGTPAKVDLGLFRLGRLVTG